MKNVFALVLFTALISLYSPTLLSQAVEYTFDTSAQGWRFAGRIITYDAPGYTDTGGHIGIRPLRSTNTFSYWYSPYEIVTDGKLYCVKWEMGADTTDPDDTV